MPAWEQLDCGCVGAGASLTQAAVFGAVENNALALDNPGFDLVASAQEGEAVTMTPFAPQPMVVGITPGLESDYPVGSVAQLAAPFPVDRGLWVQPRIVDQFIKKPNGRWMSYPGLDVSYPSLAALALAAPVVAVDVPAVPEQAPMPEPYTPEIPSYPEETRPDSYDTPPEAAPESAPVNRSRNGNLWAWGALALGAFLYFRR